MVNRGRCGARAASDAFGKIEMVTDYGNACSANDGHGYAAGTALPCADPSTSTHSDARSASPNAAADYYALRSHGPDRRNARSAGDRHDVAMHVSGLRPGWTRYDCQGLRNGSDWCDAGSPRGRSDSALYVRRTDSSPTWNDHAAVLPHCYDRRLAQQVCSILSWLTLCCYLGRTGTTKVYGAAASGMTKSEPNHVQSQCITQRVMATIR